MWHQESITSTEQVENAFFLYFRGGEKGGSASCLMWRVYDRNCKSLAYYRFDLLFFKKCANTDNIQQATTAKWKIFRLYDAMPSFYCVKTHMQQEEWRVSAGCAPSADWPSSFKQKKRIMIIQAEVFDKYLWWIWTFTGSHILNTTFVIRVRVLFFFIQSDDYGVIHTIKMLKTWH